VKQTTLISPEKEKIVEITKNSFEIDIIVTVSTTTHFTKRQAHYVSVTRHTRRSFENIEQAITYACKHGWRRENGK